MRDHLDDWRAKADYEQDESEEEQALFQPAPAANSRLERGFLAFGYGAIGVSMAIAASMLLAMAWSGQISSFGLIDVLNGLQRVLLFAIGGVVGLFALWLFALAYVRGKGDAIKDTKNPHGSSDLSE